MTIAKLVLSKAGILNIPKFLLFIFSVVWDTHLLVNQLNHKFELPVVPLIIINTVHSNRDVPTLICARPSPSWLWLPEFMQRFFHVFSISNQKLRFLHFYVILYRCEHHNCSKMVVRCRYDCRSLSGLGLMPSCGKSWRESSFRTSRTWQVQYGCANLLKWVLKE